MLLAGEEAPPVLELREVPVWNRFVQKWNNDRFRPCRIVEYDRTTFICAAGNVRVTFDRAIRSAEPSADFFAAHLPGRPIMPVGMQLLEVKYDQFLPDYLYKAMELDSMQRIAYSKFYLCERYNLQGRGIQERSLP